MLSPGPVPEQQLEEILAARRRELDETAARFDASIADLERREELLRDSRASVERVLRLGRTDLETRENELTDFLRELTEREARLSQAEAELARRREALGAVELKRAAVERRERDASAREARLAELEAELEKRSALRVGVERHEEDVRLAFVPGAAYRLVEHAATGVGTGATLELDSEVYSVARVGPSPLPGDPRRCAYLVRGPRSVSPDGSS